MKATVKGKALDKKPSAVKKSCLKLKFLKAAPKTLALEDKAAAPAKAACVAGLQIGATVIVCSDRAAHLAGREAKITQIVEGMATLQATSNLAVMQAPLADLCAGGYKDVKPKHFVRLTNAERLE